MTQSLEPHPDNPLIVQGDHTVLLEVDNPRYTLARDALARFAELVKSPEHVHTYRITPLSIWNACAAGQTADRIVEALRGLSKYPLPGHVATSVRDSAARYGCLKLSRHDDATLCLAARDLPLAEELAHQRALLPLLGERVGSLEFLVAAANRGRLKQTLIKLGFPTEDLAGYVAGDAFAMALRAVSRGGHPFAPRDYQREAAGVFHAGGEVRGGSGVIVLPCGAGKTIVGMACMAEVQASALILATNVTAARQWREELLDKTTLREEDIGEYTGNTKEVRPVTIATYQILTHRRNQTAEFTHFALFDERNWGLIIYDEVHLLPAPVFQITATLQARRRLGLTATLVREDGKEDDVFALIGPKKYDVPWKEMEKQGWIATATCTEIRLPMTETRRMEYAVAEARHKFRIASENPDKLRLVRQLIDRHRDVPVLVIGMYVDQVRSFAEELNLPLLTGATTQRKRDEVYERFRHGDLRALVVSKIANFSVDLPDAAVAIQVSGMFGSRQEEAQRLGRILRPKPGDNQAHFYSIVSRDTVEQDFALKRQLFLCEQGYEYRILTLDRPGELLPAKAGSLSPTS
ncbi:MAG: DEAD/DEAH box helicase [Verrucomicrobiales bacterium]|nr:DEAD/DEAH box helicase [Verrucomicrobiales bacterium]